MQGAETFFVQLAWCGDKYFSAEAVIEGMRLLRM